MNQILKVIVGSYLAKQLFAKAKTALSDLVTYSFEDVRLQNFNIIRGEITTVVNIINNTDLEIPYEGIAATISHGGKQLGVLNDTSPIALAPNDTTRLALVFKVENDELLLRIADIISEGGLLEPVKIRGTIKLKGQNLPVQRDIQLLR